MTVNTESVLHFAYNLGIMDSQGARLREARKEAGFKTAKAAALKFGWVISTYTAHENNQNGMKEEIAAKYAEAFNVSKEWLLLGVNPGDFFGTASEFRLLSEAQRKFVLDALASAIAFAKANIRKIA